MAVQTWVRRWDPYPVRARSQYALKYRMRRRPVARRAPRTPLVPTTTIRSFARDLAHKKARRLKRSPARRRRSVRRRMALDHDPGVAGHLRTCHEEELVGMAVDLDAGVGEWSAAVRRMLIVTPCFPIAIYVAEELPQVIEEMAVDIQIEDYSKGVSALAEDADSSMICENALSAIAKVLRDADDDGSALSESPSADLLPNMVVEDDVVLSMETGTATVRLEDDEVFSDGLYSHARALRSCRSGYYRYEPYPVLRMLRLRPRTRHPRAARNKTLQSGGDEILVDEGLGATSEDEDMFGAEFNIKEVTVAPSNPQDTLADLGNSCRAQPNSFTAPLDLPSHMEEEKYPWPDTLSDTYWYCPPNPYEKSTLPKNPAPYPHVPPHKENQDDWLNEASDLYWERPFTPAVVSSPTLVQIEVGLANLKLLPAVTSPRKPTKPKTPIISHKPASPPPAQPKPSASTPTPTPAHVPVPVRTSIHTPPSPRQGASMSAPPAPPTPIQVPPKVLHRETQHDKENRVPAQPDLEAGPKVTLIPRRAPSLVHSVVGMLRTWMRWGSL